MHMTGLCFASSSLGDRNCICEGGGSVLLFNVHDWDPFVPASLQAGTLPFPRPLPVQMGTAWRFLGRAKAGRAGLVGGGLGWGAGELGEPG